MEYVMHPTPLHKNWINMEIVIDVNTMRKEERNTKHKRNI